MGDILYRTRTGKLRTNSGVPRCGSLMIGVFTDQYAARRQPTWRFDDN